MAFSGSGPHQAEINITPLIDILLVLIIVFMVVVSMSQQKGLEAQIPQPATGKDVPTPERTIVVQVEWNADNQPPSFKINEQSVTLENLKSRLEEIFATRVEKVAFVKGDKQLDFDYVAQVVDLAHEAGVERVGLITSEPRQEAHARTPGR